MSALIDATNTIPSDVQVKVIDDVIEAPEAPEAPEESREEKDKRLQEHLVSGRRFMKLHTFDKAVESLSEAAELSSELFGEGHEDTFDVTFLYGQCLLELAKMEEEVLANAMTNMPKDSGEEKEDVQEGEEEVKEEEREEIRQQVEEALGLVEEKEVEDVKNSEAPEDVKPEGVEVEDVKEAEAVVQETTDASEVNNVEESKEEVAEGDAEEENEDDDEEEEDNMKLAWEILETARCICEKKLQDLPDDDTVNKNSWLLKHADVLTSLGEHGIVDSKYEQAQKDLQKVLEIRKMILPTSSRLLANTNHLLAKAFSLDSDFEKAAEHYSEAKKILLLKVVELKTSENSDEEEVKELEELIPEIDARVVDALSSAEQIKKLKEAAKKELEDAAVMIKKLAGNEDQETNDISGLIRRGGKRGADEPEDVGETKKAKEDETVE